MQTLEDLVISKSISWNKLAKTLGVAPSTTWRWGQTNDLPASQVRPLANALGVTPADILDCLEAGQARAIRQEAA